MFLNRMRHRSGNNFQHGVPIGPPQSTFPTGLLPTLASFRILDKACPGIDWIFVIRPCFPPKVNQRTANVWILHSKRAVEVPAERDAALTPPRLVRWDASFEQRIIKPLHLPSHDAVFDMNIPGAPAGAIHTMRTADDFVVLPSIAIELFPLPTFGSDLITNPSDCVFYNTHQCTFVA